MNFSFKEQMVALLWKGISYKTRFHYLKYLFQHQLIDKCLNEQQINRILNELASKGLYKLDKSLSWNTSEVGQIKQLTRFTIIYGETIYPKLWYQLAQPPLIIFYQGQLEILKKPLISIVGSRNVTAYGKMMTQQLVKAFANEGWVVVSGLARGIDTVVHQTSIEQLSHSTISIIASGINRYYPKENMMLQRHLMKEHLVLSEFLPDSPPLKHHFIMRNRLIAGIAPITCVMEAAEKSGSLITANYALQCNRELFALPGRVTDTQSRGCNQLIAAGAYPIVEIEETISLINNLFSNHRYL